jgi:alkyl-hydroperoxide reductase/thiol specific antioxidant family protein
VFCREHVAQLREREKGFQLKGVRIAALSLGDMEYARIFREDTGITFPLLIDTDRVAYRAIDLGVGSVFHLFRADNREARTRAKAAGHSQRKLGKNPFQLGGSFIFGPGNEDIYAHANQTFGDNPPMADLLAALP